ncbi:MAG: undecaprenyl-diphosphatase UppP [Patescibacteria group bacterium]|jgi:undecaprenyl-diphosphatase
MTLFDGLLLGTVQGLTEFLPVSSSGHLILMRELLGLNTSGGLAFDAILQLGTILAVFVYFRRDIWNLPKQRALLGAIVVGTIPALVLGLLLEDMMETTFRSPLLVAGSLVVGSLLFVLAERLAKRLHSRVTVQDGLWIGLFQTLALVPGISRSGATISGGLFRGLTRETAARFSFLLALPIITGSGIKKLLDVMQDRPTDIETTPLLLAFVTAFLIGLACIHFLLSYLKHHTLMIFVWYRLALALAVVLFVTLR